MNIDALTAEQSDALRRHLAGWIPGKSLLCCQVLKVSWPDQTRSYVFSDTYRTGAYQPINERVELGLVEARLRAPNPAKPFYRIVVTADISDNPLNVEFFEGPQFDTNVRQMFDQYGENLRGEVFLYFPAIDLLVSEFVGHFKQPTLGTKYLTPVTLLNGFKGKLLQVPPFRIGWNGCQAAQFGGQIRDLKVLQRNACRYDRHLGGNLGTLDPVTGGPRTFCPQDTRQTCDEVMGTATGDAKKHFFGSDTVFDQSFLGHRANSRNLTNTYNLESRARDPLGVLIGYRKKFPLQLVQAAKQDPLSSSGTLLTRWLISHGPIQGFIKATLRGKTPQGADIKLGEYLQTPLTNFYTNTGTNAGNLSLIAHCSLNENPVKSAEITFDQIQAEGEAQGFREVRIYNADGTYTDQYSTVPTWAIRLFLEHPRVGLGITPDYFNNSAWLKCAEADAAQGLSFNHFVQGGDANKVFEDICRSMRKSLPFWHGGKLCLMPLGKRTITGAEPTFYAQGDQINILPDESGMPAIKPLRKSKDEIPRTIWLNFDDDGNEVYGRIIQARAQKLIERDGANWPAGDEREHVGIGVTNETQAKALAASLLEVGEFDKGGTRNNLGFELVVKGVTPEVLGQLHPWALCRVVADDYDYFNEPGPNYDGTGPRFEWFQVIAKERDEDLRTKLTVWAYPRGLHEEN